jgi:hypothetical protein
VTAAEERGASRLLTAAWSTFHPSLKLPNIEANLTTGNAVASAFVRAKLIDADEWVQCCNVEVADLFDALDREGAVATDTFVVYMCSHGLFPVQSPFRLATNRTVWLDEVSRAVVVSHVLASIVRSKARDKVLVLDACFAGNASSPIVDALFAGQGEQSSPAGCTVLTATSPVELALAGEPAELPVFTSKL